jgi:hypothetical protein
MRHLLTENNEQLQTVLCILNYKNDQIHGDTTRTELTTRMTKSIETQRGQNIEVEALTYTNT